MHFIYTDAGSRNNQHAACSWLIINDSTPPDILYTNTIYLGPVTNNVAEITAITYALISALSGGIKDATLFSDSKLIISQINGEYQIKNATLQQLHNPISDLKSKFNSITFKWAPRETPFISMCDSNCDLCIDNHRA